ncbi:MAG: hypothetical protein AAF841_01070 [Pseudomonadota bacterium]
MTQALDIIGQQFGIQFSGSRVDRIRVNDLKLSGDAEAVIDAVMTSARMDAFRFNGQIYYAPAAERAVRLVPLSDGITSDLAKRALADAGLIFSDFSISDVAGGSALVMSGPIQYLALAEGVLNALTAEPDAPENTVRVRRGGLLETADTSVSAVANQPQPNQP